MAEKGLSVVTGAFGYTGKYIAQQLLARGYRVITLTGHPERPHPFGDQVRAYPFNFDRPAALTATLRGADTLYNTYWVRFNRGQSTFDRAVANTRVLLRAAQAAGVRRIVHISITNPSPHSPLPYFRGKAILEGAVRQSGLSYAILRPTVIFGREDILINNIAWLLRRFPVFAVPGDGRYRLQPIYVEDVAELAVKAGEGEENCVIDAVGPETFTFVELVRTIRDAVGSRARLVPVPPTVVLFLSHIIGLAVGDVLLTREEIAGLMDNLLVTDSPPTGTTPLTGWVREHASSLGVHYAHEIRRHYRR